MLSGAASDKSDEFTINPICEAKDLPDGPVVKKFKSPAQEHVETIAYNQGVDVDSLKTPLEYFWRMLDLWDGQRASKEYLELTGTIRTMSKNLPQPNDGRTEVEIRVHPGDIVEEALRYHPNLVLPIIPDSTQPKSTFRVRDARLNVSTNCLMTIDDRWLNFRDRCIKVADNEEEGISKFWETISGPKRDAFMDAVTEGMKKYVSTPFFDVETKKRVAEVYNEKYRRPTDLPSANDYDQYQRIMKSMMLPPHLVNPCAEMVTPSFSHKRFKNLFCTQCGSKDCFKVKEDTYGCSSCGTAFAPTFASEVHFRDGPIEGQSRVVKDETWTIQVPYLNQDLTDKEYKVATYHRIPGTSEFEYKEG